MFVLSVIPLSRTAPPHPLSYRSSTRVKPGAIVSVPLRKKILPGLVVECIPVREAKYALKSASFSLSKSTDLKQGQLPAAFLTAAEDVALYHATTLGAVLSALVLPVIPVITHLSEAAEVFRAPKLVKGLAAHHDSQPLEAPLLIRCAHYEKLLKKSLGNAATLLVVPTQAEADEWSAFLKSFAPLVLSGKLSPPKREAALAAASTCRGLIIATPGFVWVPIQHLERIIIERPSAGSYTLAKRPYLDLRYAIAALARARAIPLQYGDYPLPLEYRKNPAAGLLAAKNEKSFDITIVDTRIDKKEKTTSVAPQVWKAVPDKLLAQIHKTLTRGGRVAVLAVRKGYAPTVVCGDCGTTLTDGFGRTLTLATIKGVRVFRSSDGAVTESAESFCKVCGSWNLKPLGIGIERVEEELAKEFPQAPLLHIDSDTRSLKKIRESIETPGTIILGTERILPFLSPLNRVELGVIASADSLLAMPFWRSRERFVRIGYMLADRSERTIIATRQPEDTALAALDSSSDAFWKEETSLRKILSYPPFGTLLVFHLEGTAGSLRAAREAVRAACVPFVPYELPERVLSGNTLRTTMVLQLKADQWPDPHLSARIAELPPSIRVYIDSETLW